MKVLKKILITTMLATCPALLYAQDYGFQDWDANQDDFIDQEEFDTAFQEEDTYGTWDGDDDEIISEDEWLSGFDTYYDYYDEYDVGTYDDWDLNDDEMLDEDEFGEGTYDLWDDDDDGLIDNDEWDTYNDYAPYED